MDEKLIKKLNIENLIPGMQNVDIVGRISRVSIRDFATDKGSGRVASISISDETGTIRLVLWDNEIEKLKGMEEGDVAAVSGYIRQGLFGPEMRLGRYGNIEKSAERVTRRSRICDLAEGHRKEIRAAVVQLFESNPFYEVCPKCKLSLKEDGEKYMCVAHGEVEPAYALHVSGILDDGTDNIRCVMFKEQAEKILGLSVEEAKDIVLRKGTPVIFQHAKLGEYVFDGQVRRNRFFDRLEFVVNKIRDVDVKEEIELLMEK